jgi:hypothetical protein
MEVSMPIELEGVMSALRDCIPPPFFLTLPILAYNKKKSLYVILLL